MAFEVWTMFQLVPLCIKRLTGNTRCLKNFHICPFHILQWTKVSCGVDGDVECLTHTLVHTVALRIQHSFVMLQEKSIWVVIVNYNVNYFTKQPCSKHNEHDKMKMRKQKEDRLPPGIVAFFLATFRSATAHFRGCSKPSLSLHDGVGFLNV